MMLEKKALEVTVLIPLLRDPSNKMTTSSPMQIYNTILVQ